MHTRPPPLPADRDEKWGKAPPRGGREVVGERVEIIKMWLFIWQSVGGQGDEPMRRNVAVR